MSTRLAGVVYTDGEPELRPWPASIGSVAESPETGQR